MEFLIKLIDIIHLIIVFHPFIIFFIPVKILKIIIPWILLINFLIPIHWNFFEKCILTKLSLKIGAYKDSVTKSEFTEKYLKWLYKPIMNLIGWKWDDTGIRKMSNLHWLINFIIVWYIAFFYL